MPDRKTRRPSTGDMFNDLLAASEAIDVFQESLVARRRSLEADGFSPTIAEQMVAAIWIGAFTTPTAPTGEDR